MPGTENSQDVDRCERVRTAAMVPTDQKVGGSSPSERAAVFPAQRVDAFRPITQ
jgi:hypothetical protein